MEKLEVSNSSETEIDIFQEGEQMVRDKNHKPSTRPTSVQPPLKEKEDSIDCIRYIYEQINNWIENADNKVSVSCAIFSGVFGVITFLAERFIKIPQNPVINELWKCIYKGSFVVSLLFMAIAILFYAMAIKPNLKSSGNKKAEEKSFPIFYGDIQALNFDTFKKRMEKGTNKEFMDELILESWHNSRICMKKMQRFKWGVILSIIAIGSAFLSSVAHFMMYR